MVSEALVYSGLSYLCDHKMRVKCVTAASGSLDYSDIYELKYGTPQGSCLGPLIFLIFNNDLHLNLLYSNCILFADDTTIYHTHKNLRHLEWCIREDLTIISDWFKANQLMLNLSKSVCILFNNDKDKPQIKALEFGNISIPLVFSTKFLGVTIDKKLLCKEHFNKLLLKVKRNMNLLKTGKNFLSLHARKILYYSHIFSHISYCIGTWGGMVPTKSFNKLQKLQNKCIHLVDMNKKPLDEKYRNNKVLKNKRDNSIRKL